MSDLPRVIGLAGKSGCGKDTAGKFFKQFGYHRIAFADALKREFAEVSCSPPQTIDMYLEAMDNQKIYWRKKLQDHGMMRREQDYDYWIKQSGLLTQEGRIIVTDVRFINEINAIHALDGVVVYLFKLGQECDDKHVSESLRPIDCDRICEYYPTFYHMGMSLDCLITELHGEPDCITDQVDRWLKEVLL